MKIEEAKKDVINYLSLQEDAYFNERNTTREAVLSDNELIAHIASEHLSCVTRFGCERDWSVKDACDSFPGISHDDFTSEQKTHRLNVTVGCLAVYNSSIDVPIGLSLEEALDYAKEHIRDIPLGVLEYVPDSDELDVENCDFDDRNAQANRSTLDQQIKAVSSCIVASSSSSHLKTNDPEPEI